jgi:Ca2+/Na+ antiporter
MSAALIMIVSAAAIILLVKYGLLRGIDHIANAMNWSAKARGQLTGYATSVPEFVCLVSAGLAGVWQAGLWNIASSNIINGALMLFAVSYYRQFGELFNKRFLDEIFFAALAVFVPLVLMRAGLDTQWYLVPILLGFFVVYQVVDKKINRPDPDDEASQEAIGNLPLGIILGLSALIAIAIAGMFLGGATAEVVETLDVHPAIAGWILGVVTSIPEMVSFFAVYAAARREGRSQDLNDTQEALDNLTGSNMSNVGIVYPLGLLAFLLGGSLLGG